MKAQELVDLIHRLVKEEITKQKKMIISETLSQSKSMMQEEMNKQMTRLLAEVLRSSPSNGSTATIQETRNSPSLIQESARSVHPQSVPRQPRKFTGIPEIDAALNNTVADLPKESVSVEEINDTRYTPVNKIGDTEPMSFASMMQPSQPEINIDMSSKMNMLKSIVGTNPQPQIPSALDVPDSINPLSSVFKRDFRSVMKNIDNIKSNMRSGGGLPMPQVDPNEWRQLDSQ